MSYKEVKKKLREYPELWALCQDWLFSAPEVRVCRATAISFLEKPLEPTEGMAKLTAYLVVDGLRFYPLSESFCGQPLIEDATRGRDTCNALRAHLTMSGYLIPYVFLLETDSSSTPRRITVVKPPREKKNFLGYVSNVMQKIATEKTA